MDEVYRKRGSVVRYENGITVRVREAGEAFEDGVFFRCAPLREGTLLPELDPRNIHEAVRQIESVIASPVAVERIIVSEGLADHEQGGRRWSEETRRLHLSLVNGRTRVLIDEGDLACTELEQVVTALARLAGECEPPPRIRLAARVMAALMPSLPGVVPPNVALAQRAGGIDGKGFPVNDATGPDWPNWYRPSYRVRPQKIPLNLTARCSVTEVDPDLPEAVAIADPPCGLAVHVLWKDRRGAFTSIVRIGRIEAIGAAARWFPYGGGVWGSPAEVITA